MSNSSVHYTDNKQSLEAKQKKIFNKRTSLTIHEILSAKEDKHRSAFMFVARLYTPASSQNNHDFHPVVPLSWLARQGSNF